MAKTAYKPLHLFCLALFCVGSLQGGAGELGRYLIHSQQPAKEWVDGFPLGNGWLGAMVLGDPSKDRIALNHGWLWRRSAERREIKVAEKLPEFRRLFLAGRFEEAGRLMGKEIQYNGGKMEYTYVNPFQPLGDLQMDFSFPGEVADYRRQLDMDSGIVDVTFGAGKTRFRREYFVSALADNVLAVRITSDQPHMISGEIQMARISDPECSLTTRAEGNLLVLEGRFREGFPFAAVGRVTSPDGEVRAKEGAISIQGASEVLIVTAMATGHESSDPADWCKNHLRSLQMPFEKLRHRHVLEHQGLFRRVRLSLGDPQPDQPTGELVDAAVRTKQASPYLIEKIFDFGRYLMISGSRPGGLPMNLQGIWNDQLRPPWDSDYHLDINLEMNYWLAETCNLSELAQPLFDWVEARVPQGRRLAQDLYGYRGIFFLAAADSTGIGNPDNLGYSWPSAAGWLAQHFWRHWEYTGDRAFLERRAYPFLKEIASFYQDYLIKDGQGKYVIVPSMSPENQIKGRPVWTRWTTVSSTIDLEIAREVFTHLILASEILKVDSEQAARWRRVLEDLPTPSVNKQGELVEWSEDVESDEPGHQEMSKFYGLFPGDRITPDGSPALAVAARTALQHRLQFGYGNLVGFSYPWLAALFARLSDGDSALAQLDHLARCCVNDNLLSLDFDYRRQGLTMDWFAGKKYFVIEAGLGTTAAIAEMLLQSQGGVIRILPALPQRWPAGSVAGLVAQGGFVIDAEWHAGRLERVKIQSRQGNRCRVKLNLPGAQVRLSQGGRPVSFNRLPGEVIEFQTLTGKDYQLIGL
jgi:alpha-L-fucosidase 2